MAGNSEYYVQIIDDKFQISCNSLRSFYIINGKYIRPFYTHGARQEIITVDEIMKEFGRYEYLRSDFSQRLEYAFTLYYKKLELQGLEPNEQIYLEGFNPETANLPPIKPFEKRGNGYTNKPGLVLHVNTNDFTYLELECLFQDDYVEFEVDWDPEYKFREFNLLTDGRAGFLK